MAVAPNLVMSIVNLISTMLIPDYSMVFLVTSKNMEEAQRRESVKFEGIIGAIQAIDNTNTPHE